MPDNADTPAADELLNELTQVFTRHHVDALRFSHNRLLCLNTRVQTDAGNQVVLSLCLAGTTQVDALRVDTVHLAKAYKFFVVVGHNGYDDDFELHGTSRLPEDNMYSWLGNNPVSAYAAFMASTTVTAAWRNDIPAQGYDHARRFQHLFMELIPAFIASECYSAMSDKLYKELSHFGEVPRIQPDRTWSVYIGGNYDITFGVALTEGVL